MKRTRWTHGSRWRTTGVPEEDGREIEGLILILDSSVGGGVDFEELADLDMSKGAIYHFEPSKRICRDCIGVWIFLRNFLALISIRKIGRRKYIFIVVASAVSLSRPQDSL